MVYAFLMLSGSFHMAAQVTKERQPQASKESTASPIVTSNSGGGSGGGSSGGSGGGSSSSMAAGSMCPTSTATSLYGREALTIDDVAFGILTSERFLETRLASLRRTWLRRVRHVVFYSESVVADLPTVRVTPPPSEELVGGGAWKNFPALVDLQRRFPTKAWIFFTDDDTYVFLESLLQALGKYDPNRDYYVGLYWTPRIDMEWTEVKLAYASGGAGYALSRAMLTRLAPVMPSCQDNFTRWAGDIRVGKCVRDLGVKITPGVGFHHEGHDKYQWNMDGGGFPYGHLSSRASVAAGPVVTFHHLTVDAIALYNRMQLAQWRGPRGELYQWDFSRHFLREFVFTSSELGHHIRILLGISVEVKPIEKDDRSGWRKDFSDPVYIRPFFESENQIRTESDLPNPRRFDMVISKVPEVFNGDGCKAPITDPFRFPIRKSAVIAMHCDGCPGDIPPAQHHILGLQEKRMTSNADAKVCRVFREDGCTLHIDVALPCPPRLLVYAPMLDVGTTPGGNEIIRAGVPSSCQGNIGVAQVQAAALPNNVTRASRATNGLPLFVSLTQGTLVVRPLQVTARTPGCSVRVEGRGAAVTGGTLRVVDGPEALWLECTCATGARFSDMTFEMRVRDYTSPAVSFSIPCGG